MALKKIYLLYYKLHPYKALPPNYDLYTIYISVTIFICRANFTTESISLHPRHLARVLFLFSFIHLNRDLSEFRLSSLQV